jgi:hypothetical protein
LTEALRAVREEQDEEIARLRRQLADVRNHAARRDRRETRRGVPVATQTQPPAPAHSGRSGGRRGAPQRPPAPEPEELDTDDVEEVEEPETATASE